MHPGKRFLTTFCACVGFLFINSVSSVLLEKIFIHDHDREEHSQGSKKMGRIDFGNEDVRRALLELRNTVPQYTGYFFIDLISELVKTIFVFFVSLLAPGPQET